MPIPPHCPPLCHGPPLSHQPTSGCRSVWTVALFAPLGGCWMGHWHCLSHTTSPSAAYREGPPGLRSECGQTAVVLVAGQTAMCHGPGGAAEHLQRRQLKQPDRQLRTAGTTKHMVSGLKNRHWVLSFLQLDPPKRNTTPGVHVLFGSLGK